MILQSEIQRFAVKGEAISCEKYGNGHINDTYLVLCQGETSHAYILQRINTAIFQNVEHLMHNIASVTSFLKQGAKDPRSVLTLVPTVEGESFFVGESGAWRMYEFVSDSLCLEKAETKEDFYESAKAFGAFQRRLSDFDASLLYEIIPDFHNTPKRYENFLRAVEEDVCGRAAGVREEIEFIKARADFYPRLMKAREKGDLPLRVSHNDTKINNVLLDKNTRKGLCVIDLDTVMPGFSVTDFGDSIRFGANTAAEDEKDLSKVHFSLPLYETFAKGFLEGCGGALLEKEILLLPEGAKMMTLECGMRFLADYLQGNIYFKTAYEEHNLVRFRTQRRLVEEMEENLDAMKEIVKKLIR